MDTFIWEQESPARTSEDSALYPEPPRIFLKSHFIFSYVRDWTEALNMLDTHWATFQAKNNVWATIWTPCGPVKQTCKTD